MQQLYVIYDLLLTCGVVFYNYVTLYFHAVTFIKY